MGIRRDLFQKHFKFQMPSAMLKNLYNRDYRNNKNDNALVVLIMLHNSLKLDCGV